MIPSTIGKQVQTDGLCVNMRIAAVLRFRIRNPKCLEREPMMVIFKNYLVSEICLQCFQKCPI